MAREYAEVTGVVFGVALAWTYILALFSISWFHSRVNPVLWQLLRFTGMNYIAYAFAVDFIHPVGNSVAKMLFYLPFATLAIGAPLLCLAATIWQSSGVTYRSSNPRNSKI